MQKGITIFGPSLMLTLFFYGVVLQTASYPLSAPDNTVYYKQFQFRYSVPEHPELYVYEVRKVFYVRRTTSKPKAVRRLTDDEMEIRIQCDFKLTDLKCAESTDLSKSLGSSISTNTSVALLNTAIIDQPFLPELPKQLETLPNFSITKSIKEFSTNNEDYTFETDNDYDDIVSISEDENRATTKSTDYPHQITSNSDYFNSGNSIGGNDMT